MKKIESDAIKQQINFEKYKNGEANKIISLFDSANKDIIKYVKETTDIDTKKRYTEIARKIRDVSKALKEKVEAKTDIYGVIDYELKKNKIMLNSLKPLVKKLKGGTVDFLYPTREQIKTAALFKPATNSMTFESYLEGLEAGLYNTWDSAIRTGYLSGMPTQEVVKMVMGKFEGVTKIMKPGAINTLRNSVYANTRTMLQSFANETRERIFAENEKYFGGKSEYKYEFLATLDKRTCLVCGNLDGKLFKTLKDAPKVPLHIGCRCIVIPYFEDIDDLRASRDGYVNSKITFEQWLKEQDKKTKLDVLGPSRYEIYKKGKKISQFVDNGKVLTIKELNERL